MQNLPLDIPNTTSHCSKDEILFANLPVLPHDKHEVITVVPHDMVVCPLLTPSPTLDMVLPLLTAP